MTLASELATYIETLTISQGRPRRPAVPPVALAEEVAARGVPGRRHGCCT